MHSHDILDLVTRTELIALMAWFMYLLYHLLTWEPQNNA